MSTLKFYKDGAWYTISGGSGGSGMPVGTIVSFGGTTAPSEWAICDGSAISRTTYSALFSVIGTSFGAGDGTTTFNLPDLRGRVIVGQDTTQSEFDTIGEKGGNKDVTLTSSQIPKHTHSFTTGNESADHSHWVPDRSITTSDDGWHQHTYYIPETYKGNISTGASTYTGAKTDPWTASHTSEGSGTHHHTATVAGVSTGGISANHTHSGTTAQQSAGDGAHTNLQPYQVISYIIKIA